MFIDALCVFLIEKAGEKTLEKSALSYNKKRKLIKQKKDLKKIFKQIQKKYENEPYFNDLDCFCEINHMEYQIVNKSINIGEDNLSLEKFAIKITDEFISGHPIWSANYYNRIKEYIIQLSQNVFECINNLEVGSNARAIVNQNRKGQLEIASLIMQGDILRKNDSKQTNKKLCEISNILQQFINSFQNKEQRNTNIFKSSVKGIELPLKMNNGSSRTECVTKLCKLFKQFGWLHIYGKMWCGKTQLLLLLAENMLDVQIIDLEKYTIEDANMLLQGMGDESVILLDHFVPQDLSLEGIRPLIELVKQCKCKKIAIITSGYSDYESLLRGYEYEDWYYGYNVPAFSNKEIMELFQRNGMPDNWNEITLIDTIKQFYGESPAFLMEMVYWLKGHYWIVTDEFRKLLLVQECDDLEEKMEALIIQRIQDDSIRQLLYRVSYVGHKVSETEILKIAEIPPIVSESERKIQSLKALWFVQSSKGYYEVSREIVGVANRKLPAEIKKQIDIFETQFLQSKEIDFYDLINLLNHFRKSEQYNAMGICYYQYLQFLIQHRDAAYQELWTDIPISLMDKKLQVICRINQLQYLNKYGKDTEKIMQHLLQLMQEKDSDEFLPLVAVMVSFHDLKNAICFFELCQSRDAWNKFDSQYNQFLQENDSIKYIGNIQNITFLSILCNAATIEDGEKIYTLLQLLKPEDLFSMQGDKLLVQSWGMAWERIRLNYTSNNEVGLESLLLNVLLYISDKSEILFAMVLKTWIYYWGENEKKYIKANEEYKKWINYISVNTDSYYMILDAMGKTALDYNDVKFGLVLLSEKLGHIRVKGIDELESNFDDVCACVAFLDQVIPFKKDYLKEIVLAKEILHDIALRGKEIAGVGAENEMILGEYFISMYLTGEFEKCFKEFCDFTEKILHEDRRHKKEIQELIPVLSHCIGYIGREIIYQNPPQMIGDEEYSKPKMRMFWVFNRPEILRTYDTDDRRVMIRVLLADMAQYYGYEELAQKNMLEVIKLFKQKREGTTIYFLFMINSSLYVQLLKMRKVEIGIEMFGKALLKLKNDNKIGDLSFIAQRYLLINSIFLAWTYMKYGEQETMSNCMQLKNELLKIDIEEPYINYYNEYNKILQLLSIEGFDYMLLRAVFDKIQSERKFVNLDRIIVPLFLITLGNYDNKNILQKTNEALCEFKMENEYMLKKMLNEITEHLS